MHTRPLIDISYKSEVELIERLAQQVFDKVIGFGGTITGEHGDGLARVKHIPSVYGNEMFSIFLQVKKVIRSQISPKPWQEDFAHCYAVTRIKKIKKHVSYFSIEFIIVHVPYTQSCCDIYIHPVEYNTVVIRAILQR